MASKAKKPFMYALFSFGPIQFTHTEHNQMGEWGNMRANLIMNDIDFFGTSV